MKKIYWLGVLFCLGFLISGARVAYAQTILLNYFNISPDGSDVVLEWDIQSETNVKEYRIFRRLNNEPLQAHLATISPNGLGKYQYLDDDMFKTESEVIHYELQVVMVNNEVHQFQATLSHNPTSVQRTWGSIKSMFR
ncbi:MAG: hypothetical protein NWR72_05880 [Bacteroidia bacterium]|nr:hypothetical protein [Bacteroidia bacterium]